VSRNDITTVGIKINESNKLRIMSGFIMRGDAKISYYAMGKIYYDISKKIHSEYKLKLKDDETS